MPHARLELDRFLPYRLSVLSNAVSAAIAREYAARFDLGVTERRVMAVLGLGPGVAASEVAERTAVDKVAVSRAVARLLAARRVERALHGSDRRRSMLRLSEAGFAIYDQVVPIALGHERQLLAQLSDEERVALDRILDKLARAELALAGG